MVSTEEVKPLTPGTMNHHPAPSVNLSALVETAEETVTEALEEALAVASEEELAEASAVALEEALEEAAT